MSNNYKDKKLTKCDFCRYFVGGGCAAEGSNGSPTPGYCRQAEYEYTQWLKSRKTTNKQRQQR